MYECFEKNSASDRDRMAKAGIGPYGGLHGLQLDALKSVRMVAGTGEMMTVSATQKSDLFWGLRGAGMNYGIVTSAAYTVYDFTNNGQAMNADMRIPISKNESFWQGVKSFVGNRPDGLTLDFGIAYEAAFGGVSQACRHNVRV